MRIGVDWGGTKIEAIALGHDSQTLFRKRIATPVDNYDGCVKSVCGLITAIEEKIGSRGSVGLGIPGTLSPTTGLVRNANSTWLNGKPLKQDLEARLDREVRIQNDANCFAVSEAVDGAGAGHKVVAGIILGTGCGCGIAINGTVMAGRHGIAGEFGHTPLGWLKPDEYPGERCWCGRYGCLETWISGTAFQRDYARRTGEHFLRSGEEIFSLDTDFSRETYLSYCDRLARGLAQLVNVIDPDAIVLGGGMSNVFRLYADVPPLMKDFVFSDVFDTPIVPAKHGDSSGVRGAAWLW